MSFIGIKKLGEILIDKNYITSNQLDEALREQEKSGKLIGRILVDNGIIKESDLLSAVGLQVGIPCISLKNAEINKEALKLIMPSMVRIYNIIPIACDSQSVTIALEDPLDINVIDDIRFMVNRQVKIVMATPNEIRDAITEHYGDSDEDVGELIDEIFTDLPSEAFEQSKEVDAITLQELATQEPVVRLVNVVLLQAVKDKASDIHFEPFENEFRIRYRIDGELRDIAYPPRDLNLAVSSRIKVISNLDIAERRLPQDGRIMMRIEGKVVDIRVSTLPTSFGESIVMRILDRSVINLSVDQIGLCDADKNRLLQIIKKPNGIILNTGPTGSGKTTTLYSFLRVLNKPETKIITSEDPVEYDIDGIIQVPIKPKIDFSFEQCLRHILRHDPDIIMVGEVRDAETARISVQSSLTGHLVLSTIHTNDAPSTIARLIDMGVEPYLLASTVEAIMAQRLVRILCSNCKYECEPDQITLEAFELSKSSLKSNQKFYRSNGCNECNKSGFKGRTSIFEIMIFNDEIRKLITDNVPIKDLTIAARNSGMKTLREDGLLKVFEGIISADEVLRET